MKRMMLAVAFAFVACLVFGEVAPFVAPAAVTNGTAVTNEVSFPADAVGRARVVIAQSGMATNTPTVYALYTYDANTNAVPLAARMGLVPVTNGLGAVEIAFPSQFVNRKVLLVTAPAADITRSAVLVYQPKYPKP